MKGGLPRTGLGRIWVLAQKEGREKKVTGVTGDWGAWIIG